MSKVARPAGPRCVHATAVNARAERASSVAPVHNNTLRTRSTSHSGLVPVRPGRSNGRNSGRAPANAVVGAAARRSLSQRRFASSRASASRRAEMVSNSSSVAAKRLARLRRPAAASPRRSRPHTPHHRSATVPAPQAGHASWSLAAIEPPRECGQRGSGRRERGESSGSPLRPLHAPKGCTRPNSRVRRSNLAERTEHLPAGYAPHNHHRQRWELRSAHLSPCRLFATGAGRYRSHARSLRSGPRSARVARRRVARAGSDRNRGPPRRSLLAWPHRGDDARDHRRGCDRRVAARDPRAAGARPSPTADRRRGLGRGDCCSAGTRRTFAFRSATWAGTSTAGTKSPRERAWATCPGFTMFLAGTNAPLGEARGRERAARLVWCCCSERSRSGSSPACAPPQGRGRADRGHSPRHDSGSKFPVSEVCCT